MQNLMNEAQDEDALAKKRREFFNGRSQELDGQGYTQGDHWTSDHQRNNNGTTKSGGYEANNLGIQKYFNQEKQNSDCEEAADELIYDF